MNLDVVVSVHWARSQAAADGHHDVQRGDQELVAQTEDRRRRGADQLGRRDECESSYRRVDR